MKSTVVLPYIISACVFKDRNNYILVTRKTFLVFFSVFSFFKAILSTINLQIWAGKIFQRVVTNMQHKISKIVKSYFHSHRKQWNKKFNIQVYCIWEYQIYLTMYPHWNATKIESFPGIYILNIYLKTRSPYVILSSSTVFEILVTKF